MTDDLVALVGSRLCHDLVNPLSAISNGIELLELTGAGGGEEVALLKGATTLAMARVELYRIAFGAAQSDQQITSEKATRLLSDVSADGLHRFTWAARGAMPRPQVKARLLAMLCAQTALPLGGEITVQNEAVTGTGRRITADPALWGPLTQEARSETLTSQQVHFALLPPALQESGERLAPRITDTEITLAFLPR